MTGDPGPDGLDDPAFDRAVELRDAYRIMEAFVSDYLSRGDTTVVEFLAYHGVGRGERSGDPAALEDFLRAAREVLEAGESA